MGALLNGTIGVRGADEVAAFLCAIVLAITIARGRNGSRFPSFAAKPWDAAWYYAWIAVLLGLMIWNIVLVFKD